MSCMGGMIRNDAIDSAVFDPLDDSLIVGLGTQRWIHLQISIVRRSKIIFIQNNMMGRSLASHLDSTRLTLTNNINATSSCDVLNMNRATGKLRKSNVALYLKFFACTGPTRHA